MVIVAPRTCHVRQTLKSRAQLTAPAFRAIVSEYLFLCICNYCISQASRDIFLFGLPSLYCCNLHHLSTLCVGGWVCVCMDVGVVHAIFRIFIQSTLCCLQQPLAGASWYKFSSKLYLLVLTAFIPVINCTRPNTPKDTELLDTYSMCTLYTNVLSVHNRYLSLCVDFNQFLT